VNDSSHHDDTIELVPQDNKEEGIMQENDCPPLVLNDM
jgi:hypothetical protein